MGKRKAWQVRLQGCDDGTDGAAGKLETLKSNGDRAITRVATFAWAYLEGVFKSKKLLL